MADPAIEAAQRALLADSPPRNALVAAAREALKPIRELHKPHWNNCINHCCSGKECKYRTRCCDAGCDEYVNDNGDYWPCATARLVYSSEELDRG